jgi:hypothetical protein
VLPALLALLVNAVCYGMPVARSIYDMASYNATTIFGNLTNNNEHYNLSSGIWLSAPFCLAKWGDLAASITKFTTHATALIDWAALVAVAWGVYAWLVETTSTVGCLLSCQMGMHSAV